MHHGDTESRRSLCRRQFSGSPGLRASVVDGLLQVCSILPSVPIRDPFKKQILDSGYTSQPTISGIAYGGGIGERPRDSRAALACTKDPGLMLPDRTGRSPPLRSGSEFLFTTWREREKIIFSNTHPDFTWVYSDARKLRG